MDHAHEVDLEHAPEQRPVRARERRRAGGTGIGDEKVDGPRAPDGAGEARRVRHVGDRGGVGGPFRDGAVEGRGVAPEHRHGRAGPDERRGDRAADAAAAARHQRMPACKRRPVQHSSP